MQYRIQYKNNEIIIVEGDCLQPWKCECLDGESTKCTYTIDEAREFVADYYRKRAETVSKLTNEEFLLEHGIYL